MKSRLVIPVTCALTAATILGVQSVFKTSRENREIAQLRQRVDELEATRTPMPAIPLTPPSEWEFERYYHLPAPTLPPGTSSFRFNGITVYKVPCAMSKKTDSPKNALLP